MRNCARHRPFPAVHLTGMAQAIRWIRDPRAAAVSPERRIRHGWRLQTFRVWLVRRWPKGILVRGHPCPPVPPSAPAVVFVETPSVKIHAGSSVHDDASQSAVCLGTDMGRAGKDARGPGWNPVLQNPTGEGAGAPMGGSPRTTGVSSLLNSVTTRGRMAIGRWPRGTVVRGHPCPPVPRSAPAVVFGEMPSVKIHAGSPVHDDASHSVACQGTDMGRAGKDARGPGWNPVLQSPVGEGAGVPRRASPRTTGFSALPNSVTTRGRVAIGRWPRGTVVRGHPCPPVPPSTPALVFVETPSVKIHDGSPVHDDASQSGVCHGTDMERAGKDARGPGWNPVLQSPLFEGAGAPRGGSRRTTGYSSLPNSVTTRGRIEIGRWPRAILVRGHPCPPAPPSTPAVVFGETIPVKIHAGSPGHDDASHSAVCLGTDMERAGKDARGPGWNPVLQNPAGEGAGAPRGGSPRTTESSPLPCSVSTTGGAQ